MTLPYIAFGILRSQLHAIPHPSRLRRATFLKGEGFFICEQIKNFCLHFVEKGSIILLGNKIWKEGKWFVVPCVTVFLFCRFPFH